MIVRNDWAFSRSAAAAFASIWAAGTARLVRTVTTSCADLGKAAVDEVAVDRVVRLGPQLAVAQPADQGRTAGQDASSPS